MIRPSRANGETDAIAPSRLIPAVAGIVPTPAAAEIHLTPETPKSAPPRPTAHLSGAGADLAPSGSPSSPHGSSTAALVGGRQKSAVGGTPAQSWAHWPVAPAPGSPTVASFSRCARVGWRRPRLGCAAAAACRSRASLTAFRACRHVSRALRSEGAAPLVSVSRSLAAFAQKPTQSIRPCWLAVTNSSWCSTNHQNRLDRRSLRSTVRRRARVSRLIRGMAAGAARSMRTEMRFSSSHPNSAAEPTARAATGFRQANARSATGERQSRVCPYGPMHHWCFWTGLPEAVCQTRNSVRTPVTGVRRHGPVVSECDGAQEDIGHRGGATSLSCSCDRPVRHSGRRPTQGARRRDFRYRKARFRIGLEPSTCDQTGSPWRGCFLSWYGREFPRTCLG